MDFLEFYTNKGIKLSEFNKKYMEHIDKNKLAIFLSSEETDICRSYALYIFYWAHQKENEDKTVYLISHNYEKSLAVKSELESLFTRFSIYPRNVGPKQIDFKNGVKVKAWRLHEHVYLAEPIDFAICIDIAETANWRILKLYNVLSPNLERSTETRWVINSYPRGFNLFYNLYTDAEAGKNLFKPKRVYYWEDNQKDGNWVKDRMDRYGEYVFESKYNLMFKKTFNKKRKNYFGNRKKE